MIYRNGLVFLEGKGFVRGGFEVKDGVFTWVRSEGEPAGEAEPDGSYVDLEGMKVIPGLIDIHIHGSAGADFSDSGIEGLEKISRYLASNGITAFLPTSMALPYEKLADIYESAAEFAGRFNEEAQTHADENAGCMVYTDGMAEPLGINMEGPFLAEPRRGAQNKDYLKPPDAGAFEQLQRTARGMIRIVSAAPELAGACDFVQKVCGDVLISAAHTDCSYEQAKEFFDAGARHVTHLFNAMPGIRHREPGPIEAASERDDVTAELICDGYHVHPADIRAAFKLFPGKICLISDALSCAGMPDGEYELTGQRVILKDGAAKLCDGTIAGSASNLFFCMKNALKFGIPETEAINAASLNPAKAIGADRERGSIAGGKTADFIVCDNEYNIRTVYLRGKAARRPDKH